MFACLWLDGLVSRDHKEQQIDAADTGEHIFDELFVSRNVYKSDAQILC